MERAFNDGSFFPHRWEKLHHVCRRQAEDEDNHGDDADQVEAAVGGIVAAPEFRARPNLANAAVDGPDEALELVGEGGGMPRANGMV